jgi:phage anti-repressor protein
MQRLIEVQYGEIGDEENIPTVDARDLWERLGVKTQFKDWIRRRLGETQLVEGQDFISLLKNEQRDIGAIVKKEYSLSMDAAKHIAMLERSDKGKQVRQYFITFEKKAKEELLKRAIVEEVKKIRASDVLADWLKAAQLLEVPKYYAQLKLLLKIMYPKLRCFWK